MNPVIDLARGAAVRVAPIVLLVLVWYAVVRGFAIPSRLMPGPGEVFARVWAGLVTTGDLWPHLWLTFKTTLGGYVLGSVLAVLLGSALAMNRKLELLTYPVVVLIQAVPKVAIAPLVLLWLGFDTRSTIALVALICFFPVFVGTFVGVRATPTVLLDLFQTLNASLLKTYLHCSLPNAAGSIVAGLQVGWGFALVGCVVMEFIMGMGGAGFLIDNSANALDAVTAVAAMILLGVLGYLGGSLLALVRRRAIFWEGARRG
ncbi:ABC transporter permease [Verticiella sediminum]|uniref:ABC transporter permease n=1 Tax=Verticiella sediminum TaxID=1247510 RepID=A0A556AMV4_9BURK|nr:ABC transporter permease [Verticiella sediminum]TSH94219.1 ABC transporter permease [Verticiella sediminum]